MIDPAHPLASWFLVVAIATFTPVFALPLFFAPLRWARWFRWTPPADRGDLAVYFGRCTGALALAVIVLAVPAVPDPKGHRMIFELIALIGGLMTVVHVWGAVRRIQPWTENVEIVLYAVVGALAAWLRTTLV